MSRVLTNWPLPMRAFVPGWHPHPERDGDGTWAERVAALDPQAAYVHGWLAYNAGFFWEAHVFWEVVWRGEPHSRAAHDWAKGLIQLAAACLHLKRGKGHSFQRIGHRGLTTCRSVAAKGDWGFESSPFLNQWQQFLQALDRSPGYRPRCPVLPTSYDCQDL